jgi:hypothetical protein
MDFVLDDWIYCTLYIHTTRDYRPYSAIATLHTLKFTAAHALGFSVFTSRILATDLSQSLQHTLSLICTARFFSWYYSATANSGNSTQFNSSAPKLISWQAGVSKFDPSLPTTVLYSTNVPYCRTLHYNHFAQAPRKHSLYCLAGVFTDSLSINRRPILARLARAEMCLPSRFLAMGKHVTVLHRFHT